MQNYTKQLTEDLNHIYTYIYKDRWNEQGFRQTVLTREQPHMDNRHVARYMLQRHRAAGPTAIARAEGKLFGVKPVNHATIINSLEVATETLYYQKAYKKLMVELGFLFDLKNGYRDRGVNYINTIMYMLSLPHHVLAVTLASLKHHEIVYDSILNTLISHYGDLPEQFIKDLLHQPKPENP